MNRKIFAMSAVLVMCMTAFVCCSVGEDSAAVDTGSQSSPLTSLTATAKELFNLGDGASIYIREGATVSCSYTSQHMGDYTWYFTGVTSGHGLSIDGSANLSGTVSGSGQIIVSILYDKYTESTSSWSSSTNRLYFNIVASSYTHTIAYSANGGTGSVGNTVVTDTNNGNTNLMLANNGFSRPGYMFTGWNVNGTVYQPGQQIAVGANSTVTATAMWSENTLSASANNIAGISGHSYTNQISAVANNGATLSYAMNPYSAGSASVNSGGLVTFNAPTVSVTTDCNIVVTVTAHYPDGQTKSVDAAFSVMVDPVLTFTNSATNGSLSIKGA